LAEAAVRTFEVQIVDSRYSVPTLKLVVAANLDGVREEAARILDESTYHLSVNVYLRSELVVSLGDTAKERPQAAAASSSSPQIAAPAGLHCLGPPP
jgi:hypothetical protein